MWREKLESLSYFFIMATWRPWITLGFHLSNPMDMNGCRSRILLILVIKGQECFLSLYYSGSLKSKNDEFQLPRNPVHMMEHPTGQSDFEGNVVNGVGKHKRTLKNLLVFQQGSWMSKKMKTKNLALWVYFNHISRRQNLITPHSTSPHPPRQSYCLGQGGSCPLKSLMGGVGSMFLLSSCFILVYVCGLRSLHEG